MRIKQISVTKLFGIFDHTIPLNMDERITIIHGPNGFGKTILLKMLNGLFNSQYAIFRKIPFAEFRVEFDDGNFIQVNKKEEETPELTYNSEKWWQELNNSIHIHFIETQRLLIPLAHYSDKPTPMTPSVVEYSKELAEIIESKLSESAELSQRLDRTFTGRLVKNHLSNFTDKELRHKFNELAEKYSRLEATGLLEKEENGSFQIPSEIDVHTKNVLSVYIQDMEQKLAIFDKINLFNQIIKNRFLYKHMTLSKREGLIFTTETGHNLSLEDLSSGEQQELVMLYELLFKVKPNSLILIDEPEISIHVAWAVKFLRDLQEIAKLGSFDVLIATHSPDIVSDRWDLTVELKGPNQTIKPVSRVEGN